MRLLRFVCKLSKRFSFEKHMHLLQGIRGWVAIKSRSGASVGAVELSVHISSLGNTPVVAEPGEASPIEIEPTILNFLEKRSDRTILQPLSNLAIPSPSIQIHIHVDSMLLSQAHGDSRPQIGPYHAVYQLPGGTKTSSHLFSLETQNTID